MPSEASANLARFDGIRFQKSTLDLEAFPGDFWDVYTTTKKFFGDEVKRRILLGTFVLSSGYYDAYYLQAQKVGQLISDDFARASADVDFLIGPATPTPAFGIGQKMDDPIQMYLNDIYTIGANLAGLPAVSVPCGFSGGLPVGLQLIGAHLSEPALLKVAHYFQLETDWHTRVPADYA